MNEPGQLARELSKHSDASFVIEICALKRLPPLLKQNSTSFNDIAFLAHDYLLNLNVFSSHAD